MIPISREAWEAVFQGIYKATGTMVCNVTPEMCGLVVVDGITVSRETLEEIKRQQEEWRTRDTYRPWT